MKKPLVLLINSLEGGGAERVFSLVANNLAKNMRVIVVLLDAKPVKYKMSPDLYIHLLGSKFPGGNFFKFLIFLRKTKPDIVLSFLSRSNFVNILSRLFIPHKVVISERITPSKHFACKGLYGLISKFLTKILYPFSDRIIVVSDGVKYDLTNNYNIKKNKVIRIYNPYNSIEINERMKEPLSVDDDFICAIGRLDEQKRFDLLIKAFAESKIRTHLYILGEGQLRKRLTDLIDELRLNNKVKLLGFVDNPYKYLKKSKFFVLSSDYEGFPNVLVEALFLKKAVIATDCDYGPREILEPKFNGEIKELYRANYGILVPAGDLYSLSNALVLLDKSCQIRTSYESKAIFRANDFNIQVIYPKYLAAIKG